MSFLIITGQIIRRSIFCCVLGAITISTLPQNKTPFESNIRFKRGFVLLFKIGVT